MSNQSPDFEPTESVSPYDAENRSLRNLTSSPDYDDDEPFEILVNRSDSQDQLARTARNSGVTD